MHFMHHDEIIAKPGPLSGGMIMALYTYKEDQYR